MMREYYFNDGVRERVYSNKRDAHSAALKHANATGQRVILKYRNLGVEPRRVATMRVRNNPRRRIGKSRRFTENEHNKMFNKGASAHLSGIKKKANPFLGARGRAWDAGWDYAQEFPNDFRKNPAIYRGSVMGHKYRALDYKEALRSLYHKAAELKAAEPIKPATRAETTIHTVELSTKAGNVIHRESFNTKQAANLWAKAARNQNFLATVY
jgi:hypothetical protein